ncbi:MAG TPA: tetraacyldisaccharide 4'-kinase [Tepidisphaeraceae bacterium]|nr:tetraacyldisaccharide 4'-kinase [Tepidisphaeraceae bacterium]
MGRFADVHIREIMSGGRRGAPAMLARAALAAAEPFYAGAMVLRNRLYDAGIRPARPLGRPTICIGNLTAGGTGKTPMVRWLAGSLRDAGHTVAVLSRGYKSADGKPGDEQIMLDRCLNGPGTKPVAIFANPSRVNAAAGALRDNPAIDVFLLDDGFQHRAAGRDLDIVLLNATDPFGYGHVLPRGLLREPVRGLSRAGAVVITHADRVGEAELNGIEQRVRRHNPAVPIYRATHAPAGLRTPGVASAAAPDRTLEDLGTRRFFAFCGLGSPAALHHQFQSLGASYIGHHWFADHHPYTAHDLATLRAKAAAAGAGVLVTTEKDWAKIADLPGARDGSPEIWRLDVEIRFLAEGGSRLLEQVLKFLPVGG